MPVAAPHLAKVHLVPSAHDLLALGSPVAIDVPIGLMDRAGEKRPADLSAKAALRQYAVDQAVRAASPDSRVFFAPSREHLAAFRRDPEWGRFRREFPKGRGISVQAFNICRKIAELDLICNDQPDGQLFEVHPEISFIHLAGRTLPPKAKVAGRSARAETLVGAGFPLESLVAALGPKGHVVRGRRRPRWNTDDLYDACIAAWSADRIARGAHAGLPNLTDRDSLGLCRVIHC